MAFFNLEQANLEYCAAITNLTTANSTLILQVTMYANCLSTKEVDNMALQAAMKKLQGEVKNLKSEVSSLNNSGHSGGASAANKDNCRMTPRWKREGQSHHPTWWSTTYWGGRPFRIRL